MYAREIKDVRAVKMLVEMMMVIRITKGSLSAFHLANVAKHDNVSAISDVVTSRLLREICMEKR